jgi:hypothetical protein
MMVTTNPWWIAGGSCRKHRVNLEGKAVEGGLTGPRHAITGYKFEMNPHRT